MNRKLIAVILLFALILTITACNNSAKVNNPSQDEQSIENEKPDSEEPTNQSQDAESDEKTDEKTDEKEDSVTDSSKGDQGSKDTEQTMDDKDSEDNTDEQDQEVKSSKETIKLSIEGPEDEIIYTNDNYELNSESISALEILQRLQEEKVIRFEYQGSGATAYLKGIDDYYEFDFGPLSGWMIEQNGEFPLKSIGKLEVNVGDTIRFRYTKELGEDLTN